MARKCRVCTDPKRYAIEQALVNGESLRQISGRFGISSSALQRHKQNDVSKCLARAAERREASHDADLLERVINLLTQSEEILASARKQGDERLALGAVREARETLALWAKMTGQLNTPAPQAPRQPLFILPEGSHVAVTVDIQGPPQGAGEANSINVSEIVNPSQAAGAGTEGAPAPAGLTTSQGEFPETRFAS